MKAQEDFPGGSSTPDHGGVRGGSKKPRQKKLNTTNAKKLHPKSEKREQARCLETEHVAITPGVLQVEENTFFVSNRPRTPSPNQPASPSQPVRATSEEKRRTRAFLTATVSKR